MNTNTRILYVRVFAQRSEAGWARVGGELFRSNRELIPETRMKAKQ